jgi:cell division protein FtsQ
LSYDIRRLKGILTVAVALAVVLIAIVALVFALFRAEEFIIEGAELYTEEALVDAAEIEIGSFLFGIDKDKVEESILKKCTLISDARISIKLPNKVVITVKEDSPVFFVRVGVSTVLFGADLRIAEVKQNSSAGQGVEVLLPEISSAVAGKRIVFKDDEPSYIVKLLESAVRSELFDRITLINCVNTRDAFYEVDGKYKLILGGTSELDVKLRVALEYLDNPRIANASSAELDLTSPKEVIVTVVE